MNNTGEHIHEQVIDTGVIPILVKLVKKKVSFLHKDLLFSKVNFSSTSFLYSLFFLVAV